MDTGSLHETRLGRHVRGMLCTISIAVYRGVAALPYEQPSTATLVSPSHDAAPRIGSLDLGLLTMASRSGYQLSAQAKAA